MTKLQAIKHLEQAVQHNPAFKKKLQDYFELIVLEETTGTGIKAEMRTYIAKKIAKSIVDSFKHEWWSFALGEP